MTIDELIDRNVSEVIVQESFDKKLKSGEKLRIKMGFDPTKPDLHLGHLVGLKVLKKLQEMGHTIIFIIGDYTTKIGDPSGRDTTRPILTDEEIKRNSNTYFDQIGKILDTSITEIVCNSDWFNKMTLADVIGLAGKFTVAQIIERDDFSKRIKEGIDIGMHETLYPLMQAYDSVMVKADVEFGGTDQKFNMLAGRNLQKKMDQKPQDVVMVKLLVGLDGKRKMSKSLDNYIALNDSAQEMFGKIMSIPDGLIVEYFTLCTDVEKEAIDLIAKELEEGKKNPKDIKVRLAKLIVEEFHSAEEAENAEAEFNRVFSQGEKPSEIAEVNLSENKMRLDDLLLKTELVSSKSEGRRLIEQGGVEVEKVKITDPQKEINITDGMIVQAGKRKYIKIKK